MTALGLAVALVCGIGPGAGPHLDVELGFAYGFGARSAFGAVVGATLGWTAWEKSASIGRLEVGVLGGYQYEPYAQSSAFLAPTRVSGGTHRIEAFALGGHAFHLLTSRRLRVALHGFVGLTNVAMRGRLADPVQSFSGVFQADRAELTFGAVASVGFRISERFWLLARFIAPIPYAGVAVSSYFMASAGVGLSLF